MNKIDQVKNLKNVKLKRLPKIIGIRESLADAMEDEDFEQRTSKK